MFLQLAAGKRSFRNGCIASTLTVRTSSPATCPNASAPLNTDSQSCQAPQQWLFPLAPELPLSHPLPAFHTPANGTQDCNLQPGGCKWRMASPTLLLWELLCMGVYEEISTLEIAMAMLLCSQRALKPAVETGEQKECTPSPQCSGDTASLMVALQPFCSSLSSKCKCQMLLESGSLKSKAWRKVAQV